MNSLKAAYEVYRKCQEEQPGVCSQCPLWEITIRPAGMFPTSICAILQVIDNTLVEGGPHV